MSTTTTTPVKPLGGGEFLIKDESAAVVFIPEEKNEEQLMIQKMTKDFVEKEVWPHTHRIEKQEQGLVPSLLEKVGELGLLGADMPEIYGGMELDTHTNTIISDAIGPSGSFSVAFAAHTGIGMLPILYFGTQAQKEHYLPKLISGELKAAYCLTEPGSGSDALAAKMRADLSADGTHYVLNGQKMWITNSGFADIFIVFAQVNGDQFTGFIVEKDSEGLTLGAEEDKMGIKGSSTRQVFFEQVKVPADQMLGELGKGHLIAFNSLNIGRFKLAVACNGGAKESLATAIRYAGERVQFKQPIANFGAIQHKLAEQAIRIFATESAVFRVSSLLQQQKEQNRNAGDSFEEAQLKAAEEYAIECALLKVLGSETLDFVVDETVQIHGGMGFSEEGTAARAYRDSRINRIFEGTNEINRLLAVDMLFKRALKGLIDIVGPAWEVQKELAGMPAMDTPEGAYGWEEKAVKEFKKAVLMVAGSAAKLQMDGQLNLKEEQEIIMNIADMMLDTFVAESILLRVKKLHTYEGGQSEKQPQYDAILKIFLHDATARISKNGTDAIASYAKGDLQRTLLMGLKRFTKYPPADVRSLRRVIAQALIESKTYCYG